MTLSMLQVLPQDILGVILQCCDGPSQLTLREVCTDWLAVAEKFAGRDYDSAIGWHGINCLVIARAILSASEDIDIPFVREAYLDAFMDSIKCEKLRLAEFIIDTLITYSAEYKGIIVKKLAETEVYPTPFWAGITRALISHEAPVEAYTNIILAVYMNDIGLAERIMAFYEDKDAVYISPYGPDSDDPEYYEHGEMILEFVVKHEYSDILSHINADRCERISQEDRDRLASMNPNFWNLIKNRYPLLAL